VGGQKKIIQNDYCKTSCVSQGFLLKDTMWLGVSVHHDGEVVAEKPGSRGGGEDKS
jgi:hypothetical protein